MRKIYILSKMSYCCSNDLDYHQLCNYNGINNCWRPLITEKNFACSPGLGCHTTGDLVNHHKGVFSNYGECKDNCHKPQRYNFACEDVGCVWSRHPVDHKAGVYGDLQECRQHCTSKPGIVSYDCEGGMCVLKHGSNGAFKSLKDCNKKCEHKGIVTYDCIHTGHMPVCTPVKGPHGNYKTHEDCVRGCMTHTAGII